MPPRLHLVQSPTPRVFPRARVLLASTTCTTDAAACAVSERLGSLLDLGKALPVLPMLQFVQSPNARVFTRPWEGTTRTSDAVACTVSERLGPLLDPGKALLVAPMLQLVQSPTASGPYSARVLLVGTNCAADAAACVGSERLGPLLDPGSPGRHELCRQCFSLCSNDSTHDVPSSILPWLVATTSSLEDVPPKVPGASAALKQRLLTYKRARLYSSVWQ